MTSQPPRDHIQPSTDVLDVVGVGCALSSADEMIGNGEVVLTQFCSTGLGAAIHGFIHHDNHGVFLNCNDFGLSQKSFGEGK